VVAIRQKRMVEAREPPGSAGAPAARARELRFPGWWTPLIAIALFPLVFAVYWTSLPIQSSDSKWCIPVALSILSEGNTDLDEHRGLFPGAPRTRLERVGEHVYNRYPLGPSLFALPAVAAVRFFGGGDEAVLEKRVAIEHFTAAAVVALCAPLLYALLRTASLSPGRSVLGVLVFALCTPAWSTASRAMWQHGPSMLLLSAALLLLVRSRARPPLIQFVSIPLALAYVMRPTNALPVVAVTVLVAVAHRRFLPRYLAWSLPVAVPFFAYNLWIYGAPLSPYFLPRTGGLGGDLLREGLPGNLISPSRGLFFFSPVLVFSVYGAILKWTDRSFNSLDLTLLVVVIAHLMLMSAWPIWWAGHAVGPRLLTELMPHFVYFLAPALPRLRLRAPRRRRALAASFALLAALSFFLHWRGAHEREVWLWNSQPFDIDVYQQASLPFPISQSPHRLWSWRDPQALRGLGLVDLEDYYESYYRSALQPHALGELFRHDESASAIFATGWSSPESAFRWTDARRAHILFVPAEARPAPSTLLINASSLGSQEIGISLNGVEIGEVRFGRIPQTVSVGFDGDLLEAGEVNRLSFRIEGARQPGNGDPRLLGLALRSFRMAAP
jgi:hypothetical protein